MAAAGGLLSPECVLGSWNKEAFNAPKLQSALKSVMGSDLTEASNLITIQTPDIAENGTVVPVTVYSSLKNVQSIALFAVQNKTPLVALFELSEDTRAYVSTRIKMAKSSSVIAIVTAQGKHYSARKQIEVLLGGCQD